jgi:hypothetical protein
LNEPAATDNIQSGADPRFEAGWSRLERAMWTVLVLFVLAGLAGLFGKGLFSARWRASPSADLRVHFERFLRHKVASSIQIEVSDGVPSPAPVNITISRHLADTLNLQRTGPKPDVEISSPDGVVLSYATVPPGGLHIELTQEPRTLGTVAGSIAVGGAASTIPLAQFVYP